MVKDGEAEDGLNKPRRALDSKGTRGTAWVDLPPRDNGRHKSRPRERAEVGGSDGANSVGGERVCGVRSQRGGE